MGCTQSAPEDVIVEPRKKPRKLQYSEADIRVICSLKLDCLTETPRLFCATVLVSPALTTSTQKISEESLAKHTNDNGAVPKPQQPQPKRGSVAPGYSSGASSYEGSDEEDDECDRFAIDRSGHSDILALSALRQEMVEEGDITKTVVRIEVSGRWERKASRLRAHDCFLWVHSVSLV